MAEHHATAFITSVLGTKLDNEKMIFTGGEGGPKFIVKLQEYVGRLLADCHSMHLFRFDLNKGNRVDTLPSFKIWHKDKILFTFMVYPAKISAVKDQLIALFKAIYQKLSTQ